MSEKPTASQLLEKPGALPTRSHLRELGLGRAAIDAVFRELPVVVLPGSTRPHVHVEDYLSLVSQATYRDGDVRPCRSSSAGGALPHPATFGDKVGYSSRTPPVPGARRSASRRDGCTHERSPNESP